MKATLEFNLPEEQYQFDCATKGISMDMAITEMQEEFRKMIFASVCDANGRGRFSEKLSYGKVDLIMGLVKLLTTDKKIVNMSQQEYRELLNKIKQYRGT